MIYLDRFHLKDISDWSLLLLYSEISPRTRWRRMFSYKARDADEDDHILMLTGALPSELRN